MSAKTHLQICVKGEPQETLAPTIGSHTELNPEGMLFVLTLKVHYYILRILKKKSKDKRTSRKIRWPVQFWCLLFPGVSWYKNVPQTWFFPFQESRGVGKWLTCDQNQTLSFFSHEVKQEEGLWARFSKVLLPFFKSYKLFVIFVYKRLRSHLCHSTKNCGKQPRMDSIWVFWLSPSCFLVPVETTYIT